MNGDMGRAIADLTQALRINPYDADVYGLRGDAYIMSGNYVSGRADWERVIQINPGHARAQDAFDFLQEMGY
jgi:Flp pilus assembly protein TadD